jgi:hypothetical protein
VSCGAKLPDAHKLDEWPFHGFCRLRCALTDTGAFDLMGAPAIVLAQWPGRLGGPGFENDLVRSWLDAARPDAPAMLQRHHGKDEVAAHHARLFTESWAWRLRSGGICHAFRLTRKDDAARAAAQLQRERCKGGRDAVHG